MYDITKFIHIVAAICWAGGGITLMVMTYLAQAKDGQELVAAFRVQRKMGERWFVPASFTTLLSGLALAAQANLWSELWVIASLIGYAVLAATGPFMLKRLIEKTLASADGHGQAAAVSTARLYLKAANFDYTVIVIVIALMVFKPSLSDLTLLAVLGAAFLGAVALFLVPALKPLPRNA